tara:strand:- start:35080 stop:35295 length:216 start_codon:yes stop_codon:yes gene_type:complete
MMVEIDVMAAISLFKRHDQKKVMPVQVLLQVSPIQQLSHISDAKIRTPGNFLLFGLSRDFPDRDTFDAHDP